METIQTEEQYLASYDVTEYEHPSVTVDILVFSVDIEEGLSVLLIKRDIHPFKGYLALPGSFIQMDESLEAAANRTIAAESGIEQVHLEQLYTFGDVNRDPRTRVITVAYLALVPSSRIVPESLSPNAGWYHVSLDADSVSEKDLQIQNNLPLAFDHKMMITQAILRLRGKLNYTDIAMQLLKDPEHFAIYELQKIHESIYGKKLDTPNFRRMFQASYIKTGKAMETGEICTEYAGRSSKYYAYRK